MSDPIRTEVTFEHPIVRGDATITAITLRKPVAGELRGLSLQALGQSDVASLITLIPRISEPPLVQHEVEAMDVEDLSACGGVIFDFFLTRGQRETIQALLGN